MDIIVNKDQIKTGVQQFIYMGYPLSKSPVNVTKDAASNMEWKANKNLKIYNEDFEAQLMETTILFFREKGEQWLQSMSCNDYINKIDAHLKKEEANADFLLQPETKPKMVKICADEAVAEQAKRLTEMSTGCMYMFNQKTNVQLKTMYSVFGRIPDQ